MVDKRKNMKRKLRKLRQIRRRNEAEQRRSDHGSRGDALISSMEAIIRKISMTPSGPSTIVANPTPAINNRPEVTKEDIASEIARQRELDMLKNQVHYMYDQIHDDLRTRRSKGEMMAAMQAHGTKVSPKDFDIDENDVIYKTQKANAKSKYQLEQLARHDVLDQKEITRNEKDVMTGEITKNLVNKLDGLSQGQGHSPNKSYGLSSIKKSFKTPKANQEGMQPSPSSPPKASPRKLDIQQRTAKEFVEQSFEEVTDTVKKLAVDKQIKDYEQKEHDNQVDALLVQYNKLKDINECIYDRTQNIINQHITSSPNKAYARAKADNAILDDIIAETNLLQTYIRKNKSIIHNAQLELQRPGLTKENKQRQLDIIEVQTALMNDNKEKYNINQQRIKDASKQNVMELKMERTLIEQQAIANIKNDIRNDPQLNELYKQRNDIMFKLNASNNLDKTKFNYDPYGVEEALNDRNQYIEQQVMNISRHDVT